MEKVSEENLVKTQEVDKRLRYKCETYRKVIEFCENMWTHNCINWNKLVNYLRKMDKENSPNQINSSELNVVVINGIRYTNLSEEVRRIIEDIAKIYGQRVKK